MALPKYKSKLAERMITATAEMEKEMSPEKIKIKGNAKKIYAWIEKNLDTNDGYDERCEYVVVRMAKDVFGVDVPYQPDGNDDYIPYVFGAVIVPNEESLGRFYDMEKDDDLEESKVMAVYETDPEAVMGDSCCVEIPENKNSDGDVPFRLATKTEIEELVEKMSKDTINKYFSASEWKKNQ